MSVAAWDCPTAFEVRRRSSHFLSFWFANASNLTTGLGCGEVIFVLSEHWLSRADVSCSRVKVLWLLLRLLLAVSSATRSGNNLLSSAWVSVRPVGVSGCKRLGEAGCNPATWLIWRSGCRGSCRRAGLGYLIKVTVMRCFSRSWVSRVLAIGILGLLSGVSGAAELELFGPVPYRDPATDLPDGFLCKLPGCSYSLENFEDGKLDFGISIDVGAIGGPTRGSGLPRLTDSVDIDDGVVDGTGQSDATLTRGYSYFSQGSKTFTVTFDELTTSAGLVWTDGDVLLTNVLFEAFDQNMNLLGKIDAGDLSDASYQGTTPEDRFFGVKFGDGKLTGIKALRITNEGGGSGIEIDHIQFERCALVVPEPSGLALAGLGGLAAMARRRRSIG